MFYLKYRPQTISELDNSAIRETLGKALLENNFSHAYLLIGPRGTGKTTTARLIAKIVNCTKRKKGEEPCNKCDSCQSITLGNNLDVIEIDAASNTGVDDIRDLREKVRLAPTISKNKVYIIDEVHMLSNSAFNALLKTLEEPPEHVIFVLATTDPQKLPETIISRCLVYNFGQTKSSDIVSSIKRAITGEDISASDDAINAIAKMAAGSLRDGHKILEQLAMQSANFSLEDIESLKPQFGIKPALEIIEELDKKNSQNIIKKINEFLQTDGKLKDLTENLISILRNILLLRNGITIDIKNNINIEIKLTDKEIKQLIEKIIESNSLSRDCPIIQLPLEMVIIEFCNSSRNSDNQKTQIASESVKSEFSEIWPKILGATKSYNHGLVALLRATKPIQIQGSTLSLEVFYKFHKEKLEEPKNRDTLEKVVSDIIGKDLKIKFILVEKR